jgi:flagellar biosynthesis/type III secretory pathway protein FliH
LVAHALDLLPADTSLEVRLHPDDLAALGDPLERVAPAGLSVSLRGVPDPALERGDFVIESPQRVIDGRTDTALRSLYERLAGG